VRAIAETERVRHQLNRYAKVLNETFGSMGQTLHQIFWKCHRLRSETGLPQIFADVLVDSQRALSITEIDADADRQLLANYERHRRHLVATHAPVEDHPWHGVLNHDLTFIDESDVLQATSAFGVRLRKLARSVRSLNDLAGTVVQSCEELIQLGTVVRGLPDPEADVREEILPNLATAEARQALSSFLARSAAIRGALKVLSEAFSEPNKADDPSHLAELSKQVDSCGVADLNLDLLLQRKTAESIAVARANELVTFAKRLAGCMSEELPLTVSTAKIAYQATVHSASLLEQLLPICSFGALAVGAAQIASEAELAADRLRRIRDDLSERFDLSVALDISAMLEHATDLRKSRRFAFLRPRIHRAKRLFRSIERKHEKVTLRDMAYNLEALAAYKENLQYFERDRRIQILCGKHFVGLDTDFKPFRVLAEWADQVRETFLGQDKAQEAALRVLLSGDPSWLLRLRGFSTDQRFEQLKTFLAELTDDQNENLLHQVCEQRGQREQMLTALVEKIQSIGLRPAVPLSQLRALGVTASHLQELLAASKADTSAIAVAGLEFAADDSVAAGIEQTLHVATTLEDSVVPIAMKRWLFLGPYADRIGALKSSVENAVQSWNDCEVIFGRFAELTRLDKKAWLGSSRLEEAPLDKLISKVDRALASPADLDEWVQYLRLGDEIRQAKLEPIIDAYIRKDLEPTNLERAYDLVLHEALIRTAAQAFPEIARFSGARHESLRERFRDLDMAVLDLQRQHLRAELARRPITPGIGTGPRVDWTDLALITHQIGLRQRHQPIRKLVERAGRAIQELKPCFMMSPLSIAQYLPPGSIVFDLVVMDEASQIRPEEALGAIARGRQVVVVGDRKQLPPTRFFEYSGDLPDLNDDEPVEDVGNEESILDLAAGIFHPARQLRWHYRSRHEALIAFSNDRFYDGRLFVFPSAHQGHPEYGVHLVSVKGSYRSGVNPGEAQEVIRAAVDFIKTHPQRNLGIVAMNLAQRELLAGELDRASAEQPEVQKYRERWQETLYPLFVKNLENVQGDERDVIFISMTYGPDENGRLYQRFGPINSADGHRRLNVLFTRAREKVVVFSSMDPYQIQADGGPNQGVRVLRDYLLFAKDGILDRPAKSARAPDSDFEITVARSLREKGFNVEHQVGVAGFFIDLGVRHPNRPGAFILGVECDGASYHSARSARDRDRLRQEILESLGWNIHRIWSVDWLKNSQRELDRITHAVRALVNADQQKTL
jgi:very-short-patch-repair endonuclease